MDYEEMREIRDSYPPEEQERLLEEHVRTEFTWEGPVVALVKPIVGPWWSVTIRGEVDSETDTRFMPGEAPNLTTTKERDYWCREADAQRIDAHPRGTKLLWLIDKKNDRVKWCGSWDDLDEAIRSRTIFSNGVIFTLLEDDQRSSRQGCLGAVAALSLGVPR